VDWWIGGLVDWWIGGLVDWWIGAVWDLQSFGVSEWKCVAIVEMVES
jgi:hypothetical protein